MSERPSATDDGLFVAGTGTGVGKTVVTAGIIGWLREAGIDARAIKPVQTGLPDDDAGVVADVCGDTESAICLDRLEPALAPRVAAQRTGRDLEYETILGDCRAVAADAEFAAVEGIGGLRVPLAGEREVIDLAADLGVPALVVARSGLGTLNHTALSVDALRDRGLSVRGVVLNEYEGATVAERTNPEELERMLDVPVVTLPRLSGPNAAPEAIRETVAKSILSIDQ
ncbi:dethiobiotin synthase [Natrarchaeobius sp. A-rgal3]|uniref:dethiobiotin synthase n=1 Tax=Natrarchaeobius versutus TaxID=1679078 RepID=UPI003510050C